MGWRGGGGGPAASAGELLRGAPPGRRGGGGLLPGLPGAARRRRGAPLRELGLLLLGLLVGALLLAAQARLHTPRGGGGAAPPGDAGAPARQRGGLPPSRGPPGRVEARALPASSLRGGRFDRGRVYRVRAADVAGLAPMWEVMAEVGPRILHVDNLQPYVDSIPELRKQQGDCLGPPDESYYNRFTRYIPHMGTRGDKSVIQGLEPGMQVRDGHIRMYEVETPVPRYDNLERLNLPEEVKTAFSRGGSGVMVHAGDVAGGALSYDWWEKGGRNEARAKKNAVVNSGDFYYPPGGFKEWHTNKCQQKSSKVYVEGTDDPGFMSSTDCRGFKGTGGWRGYLVYAAEDERSWMSLLDGAGRIRSVPDRSGYLNLFFLGHTDGEITWHTIYSETHRWSMGFRIDEEWLNEELLAQLLESDALVEEFSLDLGGPGAGGGPGGGASARSAERRAQGGG